MNKTVQPVGGKNYIFLLAGLLGASAVFLATYRYGPGLSHDSAAYVYAARSLMDGKGLLYFGYGTPFIQWPPLYPILLSLAGKLGCDVITGARFINSSIFGLIVYFTGRWMAKGIKSKSLALAGSAGIILSVPLLQVSSFVWSEPVFILLIILFLTGMERFLNKQRYSTLILCSVYVALACLARYAGVAAAATGIILLLLQNKRFLKKLSDAIVFGVISGLPLLIWILRNLAVSGTPMGHRTPSSLNLSQNLFKTLETMLSWIIPTPSINGLLQAGINILVKVSILTLLLAAAAAIITVVVLNSRNAWKRINLLDWLQKNYLRIMPAAVFVTVYIIYINMSASAVAMDSIGDRLMSPLIIPLAVLAVLFIDNLPLILYRYFISRKFAYVLLALTVIWLIYPFARTYLYLNEAIHNGAGIYSTSKWKESGLVNRISLELGKSAEHQQTIVYSNYPDAVYLMTGVFSQYTPKKTGPREYGLESFAGKIKQGKSSYLAWFKRDSGSLIYSVDELRVFFTVNTVYETGDGTLYIISKK